MTVEVNSLIRLFRIGEPGDMLWFCFASSQRDRMREVHEYAHLSIVLPSVVNLGLVLNGSTDLGMREYVLFTC